MDEQRILDEMERMLAADDPRLAARLAAFGQPGFGQALRTRRARASLSVMVLVLIAAVAAVIYLMSVLRPGEQTGPRQPSQTATQPASLSSRQTAQPTATVNAPQCSATFPPPRCTSGG
jgi:DUF3040 family protein